MIGIGQVNKLKVLREVDHGFYLEGDDQWGDILLPRKLAADDLQVDDSIEVFIHFDSNDMIVATQETPIAMVGDFASLKVSSVEDFGTFLDWGLDKELFLPFSEQFFKITPGQICAVYIYLDKSNRIAASTRISKFIDSGEPELEEGEEVQLLLYQITDMGIKAIINNQYSGLIYKSDIRTDLETGQMMTGYVRKIRDDFKIDLSLQPDGIAGREDLASEIIERLHKAGGTLNVSAKTPAEKITEMFGVSRKKFKIALGFLYKQRLIVVDDDKIHLAPENEPES